MMNKQDRMNTIVVAAVAGVLAGFILCLLAGFFNVGQISAVPGWLQGVSGMVAVLVSVYAVYLVSQTLKATRDTLEATKAMANDQRMIGIAQTRAWLLVESYDSNFELDYDFRGDANFAVNVRIKNYGNTPAINVRILPKAVTRDYVQISDDPEQQHEYIRYSWPHPSILRSVLPPNEVIELRGIKFNSQEALVYDCSVDLEINYKTIHDTEERSELAYIDLRVKESGLYLQLA